MNKTKLTYAVLTIALLLTATYLYATGLRLRAHSFGLGLSYVLPAVACLGLAVVSGIMAVLESAGEEHFGPAGN